MIPESLSIKEEWYIIVNHLQEGPYSCAYLKRDPRVNPDTYVWKKGFTGWVRARDVLELEVLFKEDHPQIEFDDEGESTGSTSNYNQDQEILIMNQDPFQFGLWFFLLLIIFLYVFYRVYFSH